MNEWGFIGQLTLGGIGKSTTTPAERSVSLSPLTQVLWTETR
jgi:hypothetical protein